MQLIALETNADIAQMLDGFDCPAILVTAQYQILATNSLYEKRFGRIATDQPAYCYRVSHGYQVPCDKAGEDCPLASAVESGQKERVLHIHQTPEGKEHVDVEMLPITDSSGALKYFVELLRPVELGASGKRNQPFVGQSQPFNKMVEYISRVGPTDASVLLQGESGTGKELVAQAIHQMSERKDKPLVTLECAGLTESLFESELFGHVKGAFTGANFTKQGLVEAADGGTLFLDEIGDVPYSLQVKLLRLIETGTYRPVGSTKTKMAKFRLICATHKNLQQQVADGEFRQDLFYRINVFPIYIPSLNERLSDIPVIAKSLLATMDGKKEYRLTDSAVQLLQRHQFEGNIRELRNILERARIMANTNIIDQHVLQDCLSITRNMQPRIGQNSTSQLPDVEAVDVDLKTMERRYLTALMQRYQGDKDKVAEIAGVSVRSLYRKISGE